METMRYYDMPIPVKSLLILGLFLEMCLGTYYAAVLRRRYTKKYLLPICAGTVISSLLMLIYTAEARARLLSQQIPAVSDWLCRKPVMLPVIVCFAIAMLESVVVIKDWSFRKNTITRSSIKEGIDKISSGLCFYQEGGRVILANRQIITLCFQILGRDLQNGELFWQQLSGGAGIDGVRCLQTGEHAAYQLPDGSVWTFCREKLGEIYQLRGTDTTRIRAFTEELKQKNMELEALNLRLRKYGESVDALTREKERLETKSRIHGELGQALLASRRYLVNPDDQAALPLHQWCGSIAMLRREAEHGSAERPLDMLHRIAGSTGITLHIIGALPETENIQKLFVEAAAEALTNAIRHARAKTLYVELKETDGYFHAVFRNDGTPPRGKIVEGGGLGSLRRKVEREGGAVSVAGDPDFVLTVVLPNRGGMT